jgi:hypothetical protein
MEKTKILEEFYAVTQNEFLWIHIDAKKNIPCITKIVGKHFGRNDQITSHNHIFGGRLMLSIGKQLIFFIIRGSNPRGREIGNIPEGCWGFHTAPVIGLFLKREEARKCYICLRPKQGIEENCKNINEVLEAIGEENPCFAPSHNPKYSLDYLM